MIAHWFLFIKKKLKALGANKKSAAKMRMNFSQVYSQIKRTNLQRK